LCLSSIHDFNKKFVFVSTNRLILWTFSPTRLSLLLG
jgi:hypothetical protein